MDSIEVASNVFDANDAEAAKVRQRLRGLKLFTINILGGPGCGKTTIVERTCREFKGRFRVGVIEGDCVTDRDARRAAAAGAAQAYQIETQGACHLEAARVGQALDEMDPPSLDLLIIENIGNLICPASFDLGEEVRAIVLSVPEGDDKPGKYPAMFVMPRTRMLVLNKTDLLGFCQFDPDRLTADALAVNPKLDVMRLSARTGDGFDRWLDFLRVSIGEARAGKVWEA